LKEADVAAEGGGRGGGGEGGRGEERSAGESMLLRSGELFGRGGEKREKKVQ